ncbi:TetR/AcrR family transcriptional regulator [Micromonospora sp. WMMD882]|uniref:TetR/AcrR family transcriptional regulator n=1 Tax=Micromonospora sp. WMMD882 TaxID=3015151 RepID=UPI00248AAC0C|nr:TetR/AcrR family transcriptional regulator [Micromonospora sp. WMMD882]WBB78431.1 TetR/AcrR family transcriptional regulator [Micromonospora sp. WMMD882]
MNPPLTRRQRVRDATLRELISVSRDILTSEGIEALTIRAIARKMGMTAPGIYRYFGSHRDLIDAVIVATLDELTEHISTEVEQVDRGDTAARLIVASRALRRWAVEHSREFQLSLIVAGPPGEEDAQVSQARRQVGGLFGIIFAELWNEYEVPAAEPEGHSAATRALAGRLLHRLEVPLPNGLAAITFTRCWLRLYGVVCLESMGLTRSIGDEAGVLFEAELADLARLLGLPESALDAGR